MNSETALLVVGHGSKSKEANEQMLQVVDLTAQKSDFGAVKGAFMELAEPSIEVVLKELYDANFRKITVLPYFLYNGMHIREDIPEILNKEKANYPDLEIDFAKPIGYEPLIADILLNRAAGEKVTI